MPQHDHDHHNHNHHNHGHDEVAHLMHSRYMLPVLIIAFTLALMTTFQMRQIMMERKVVNETLAGQEQPLAQVQQVSKQFESLAVGTARLAGEGDTTAQAIVADLKRVGISINPNAKGNEKAIEQTTPERGNVSDTAPLASPPSASAPVPAPGAVKPAAPVTTPAAANAEPDAPATGN